ncbi:MAG: response regulator transcription factor [Anaerolineae bacterium]|nr:response regulator transcription factor [Anaerolineae bacterium]
MIRVLICDDQWIVCEGLEAILDNVSGLEVVGCANDGAEALEKVAQLHPDVVLMDLRMPVMNGVQATQQITTKYPEVKVLVLTTYGADEWVFDALRSGAAGYLLKGTPRANLIAAVKGTATGESHIDPKVAGTLLKSLSRPQDPAEKSLLLAKLSARELDVLRLLAQGLNNTDIAKRLYLSHGTVRNYVSAILTKLNVEDRTQAALLATRYGLVR